MRRKDLLIPLGILMLIAIPVVYGVTIGKGVVFLSEIGGGNVTFGWQFTTDSITWSSNQVRFSGFNYTSEWANLGFRAPTNGHLNITQVNNTFITLDTDLRPGPTDFEVYVGGKGTPTTVTNVAAWNFVVDTVFFTSNANSTVIMHWGGEVYNISLGSIYSETEAGLYTMLFANCSLVGGGNDGANVTFTIDGCSFTWNQDTLQYEGIIVKGTPQTVTFNTIDVFASTEFPVGATAFISQTVTVTWTTGTLDIWQQFLVTGDWPTGVLTILFQDLTIVGGWTLIMSIFSIGVYNYSGPYATFAIWILGWSIFTTLVHGIALTIAVVMLVLGLGIALAKLFLDRRTT